MSTSAAIDIGALQSGYGEAMVLKGIDLTIAPGEVVAILGKNGMGKSTLLKTLMGFIRPKNGEIALFGERIAGLPPNRIARRDVAYIPQEQALFQDLSVEENLKLALARDRDFKPLFTRIEDLFPFLKDRLRQKAGTLSGGEQKMLLVARALIRQPKLILIDEITEGMQPSVIERLVGILTRERDRAGTAMLLVEQHVHFAFAVANRYAVLDLGEMPAAGATSDPAAQATVARYLSL
ncbi:branched-chain amino acid ABC transporter ATP-binding protein [Paraburkholderia solisilvae]|uniref:High-affinity branched-chain amino acid transport ATP-binding protein LivF n=1 Tax=Paraburkholderia solisilvae TaxID=624376 RepID=A0A6J5F5D3_9BURK|nr:ABC transporter ATP-binding protein [Paraburkholderia solisilvae]CAB3772971.1 High-affinity branched-chain amino acid transport ATP-binding protein LivF [Paraburkholderia solisilvae]